MRRELPVVLLVRIRFLCLYDSVDNGRDDSAASQLPGFLVLDQIVWTFAVLSTWVPCPLRANSCSAPYRAGAASALACRTPDQTGTSRSEGPADCAARLLGTSAHHATGLTGQATATDDATLTPGPADSPAVCHRCSACMRAFASDDVAARKPSRRTTG